ncbi:hypothetical protein Tco_0051611 [Tanacetum coccineum]
MRNTGGKEKETSQRDPNGPASDAALREFCDKNYNQLLPILAEKMHQEKVQQEKLKAVKARLNFEEISQYAESGTPSRSRDIRKRLGPKAVRSVSGSPEPRRSRSESPRKRDPERKMMFKRLENGVFRRLGDKEKGMSAYSNYSRRQSHYSSRGDTESYYQSSCSRGTELLFKRNHNRRTSSTKGGKQSESKDSDGGHWKSKSKKQKSSIEDDDLSQPWICEGTDPFTPRIRYFDLPKRTQSIDSYDDLKEAFLANYLQQKNVLKIPLKSITSNKEKESLRKTSCGVDEMMRITTSFLRGELAAGNYERKKSLRPWKQQELDISKTSRKEVLKVNKGR